MKDKDAMYWVYFLLDIWTDVLVAQNKKLAACNCTKADVGKAKQTSKFLKF